MERSAELAAEIQRNTVQYSTVQCVPLIHMVVEPPWSMLIACVQLNTCAENVRAMTVQGSE
jgi:hypothetical protein